MGGGGVMRAAAKITAIGSIAGSGPRGIPSMPTSENMLSSAARNATRPTATIVSSRDGGEEAARVLRPSWELEDWEFASYESDPLPRVVFGGVPTMEEAKEATADLKDALENVFLKSANSSCSEGSFIMSQKPNFSMSISNSEFSEAKTCLTRDTAASKNAVQAFKFLNESPAAQSVVASIASDPNVWNAVMQNVELTKFMQSQKTAATTSSAVDLNEQEYPNNTEQTFTDTQSGDHETKQKSFIENLKCKVVDLFNSVSSFVQNPFGGSVAEKKSSDANDDSDDKEKFMDTSVMMKLMGLAMVVIMVVVFKRA